MDTINLASMMEEPRDYLQPPYEHNDIGFHNKLGLITIRIPSHQGGGVRPLGTGLNTSTFYYYYFSSTASY